MNEAFKRHVDALEPACQRLLATEAIYICDLPSDMPSAGVYVLYENDQPVYVGRSNRMKYRLQEHCRPSSNHNTAPFAFRLAREKTCNVKASYVTKGSRAELEKDPAFKKAFDDSKQRVRVMKVKYVEERDPIRQYLLEIYVAMSTGAKYNDFDTH
jgi:predicted GIY-YIG superfamily endonuclease